MIVSDLRYRMDFHLEGGSKYIEVTDLIGTDYITVFGYVSAEVLIKITAPSGATIYANAGYATDDYTSPDFSTIAGTYTKSNISVAAVGNLIATGDYTIYYKLSFDGSGTTDLTTEPGGKAYKFRVSEPSISYNHEASCISSQIEFEDTTNYNIVDYYANTKSPTTTTRSWLIVYPDSILPNITESLATFVIGYGTSYNSGSEIYRGTYSTVLTTSLLYNLEAWSIGDPTVWIRMYFSCTHAEIFEVSCPDCACNYYTCLLSLETSKEEYRTAGNQTQVEIYEKRIQKLNWYWNLYNLAIRCGKDPTDWCVKIRNIALATAECCEDTTTTPTKITAWVAGIGGGSGTGGTTWYFIPCATGLPAGTEGDAVLFTGADAPPYFEWDIYYYTGGIWVYQGNIQGASGAYTPILHYDPIITQSQAIGGQHTLKTYTIAGGEMSSVGDCVIAEAVININAGIEMELIVSYGTGVAVELLRQYFFPMIATELKLQVEINMSGAAAQSCLVKMVINGTPDTQISVPLQVTGINNANNQALNIDIDKVLAGVIGDVTARSFKIIKYEI